MSDTNYYDATQSVDPDAYITPEGRLRVVINPRKTADAQPAPLPAYVAQPAAAPQAQDDATAPRNAIDKLLGIGGPRYKLWPERMIESALTLPAETVAAATAAPPAQVSDSDVSPMDVGRVLDMTGLIGGGSMPAAALGREAAGTLGVAGGRVMQPDFGGTAGPFYSAVEQAVRNAPQDKMSAGQWLGWLKNQPGVKQEELDWVGLPRNAGAVTKAEMLSHVEGHGPQIKEIEKRGPELNDENIGDLANKLMDERHGEFSNDPIPQDDPTWWDKYDEITQEAEQRLRGGGVEDEYGFEGAGAPRYSDYQLPGGDNYRELLLTMPRSKGGRFEARPNSDYPGQYSVWDNRTNTWAPNSAHGETGQYAGVTGRVGQDQAERWASQANGVGDYRSPHWDEPNVLVHMRMNDRDIPDVGRSLHLEEVQSDWHQQGRKQGYKNEERPATEEDIKAGHARTNQEGMPVVGGGPSAVPDAPFKTTWADLALKRAITKAAQEGYDAISWTPGEQQAARYDLSKQLNSVVASKNPDGTFNLKGETSEGRNHSFGDKIPTDKLPDMVGKDLAEKIAGQTGQQHVYKGTDLKVGGEGMKRFYDKMLVDKANAIAKKFGGKVEYKDIREPADYSVQPGPHGTHYVLKSMEGPEGEDLSTALPQTFKTLEEAQAFIDSEKNKGIRVPVLRLTPKMKDAATRRGFPLFAAGLPFSFTPVDHDPFKGQR